MKTTKQTKPKPDCIIILKTEAVDEPYIRYFTGIKADMGVLVLFPRRKTVFFHSPLEKPPKSTKFTSKPFTLVEFGKFFKQVKPKIVGYDKRHLSVAGLKFFRRTIKGAKFVDAEEDLLEKINKKSPQQINYLKAAAKITETILAKLYKVLPKMKYENEALQFLQIETLKAEGELSFDPIVASGKHATNPHYEPKPKTSLQKGFCIIDFGVKYNGYCADISRTVYLGKPTIAEMQEYKKVQNYLLELETTLKAGTSIIKNPWKIPHALGHGIGVQVHEMPLVGKDKLKENMTIAVEPGKYTTKFGIRIEDNYVVQKNGLKRISTSSRNLKIIKK